VKVHLHCIIRNLKKDKRNVDVSPPGKFSADAHGYKENLAWPFERAAFDYLNTLSLYTTFSLLKQTLTAHTWSEFKHRSPAYGLKLFVLGQVRQNENGTTTETWSGLLPNAERVKLIYLPRDRKWALKKGISRCYSNNYASPWANQKESRI